jgi:hypothetical protein
MTDLPDYNEDLIPSEFNSSPSKTPKPSSPEDQLEL